MWYEENGKKKNNNVFARVYQLSCSSYEWVCKAAFLSWSPFLVRTYDRVRLTMITGGLSVPYCPLAAGPHGVVSHGHTAAWNCRFHCLKARGYKTFHWQSQLSVNHREQVGSVIKTPVGDSKSKLISKKGGIIDTFPAFLLFFWRQRFQCLNCPQQ